MPPRASTAGRSPPTSRARDIEDYAGRRATRHAEVASRNRRIRYCVGVPAAVLAFVAGSAAVANWSPLVTAICAFVSSALSTTLGFIKPEEGRVRHSQLRAEWLLLRWTAGAVCADAEEAGLDITRSAVRRLREQMHDLDQTDV